ncbi:MAG: pyruvate:ferredoxin (flavodoxin) oxidoreductase [Bacteroidales bacterium]|nr:pyruvate:ferredoxin (flavodoxin) oxidoreductase [Bacteroidales bacterium]MCL2133089.1 pyruvate:ferredoxin (flavodoxin) oxidoreductase [Bacteroidales bacterium]
MSKKEKKFITCDGNYAAAHVAYMFSEVAAIYPITPSSTMAEYVDEWSAYGKKNLWGEPVKVVEMQSEGGAAGAVHGSLQAGALTTTFTASQGLLLMVPNMYKISGELLPAVFHVSARAVAAQALSIFGDHQDVMAARQTGFAMLASGGVQEVMDLSAVAHLSALKSRVPFLSFFDGFRTSHEVQKIEAIDAEDLKGMVSDKALTAFRQRALNPNKPATRGTAQNPDVYFQSREAANPFYDAVPDIVARYMGEISELTGRHYLPFTYYGDPKAERIIIAMGSVCDTIKETVDHLNAKGEKVGAITVHLYRPFSAKYFLRVLPATVKRIAVLDRTKEPGANGEPLYLDVKDVLYGRSDAPMVVGGRYGLSSKDTTPAQIISVFENLALNEPKNGFTIGIIDDVSFKSLPLKPEISLAKPGTYECKFYGLGSDGTVGANKNTIKIIGETTPKYCQAYFAYDSKKSGGFTCSHLRFGDYPITSPYYVSTPDLVACHVFPYLRTYDMLKGIKVGGTFLLNSMYNEEDTKKHLPDFVKRTLAEKKINFYIINATEIAEKIGLGNRTNTILQSAFFKIANVIDYAQAVKEMKGAIDYSYGRKGEAVVKMNYAAVDAGESFIKVEVPAEWGALSGKFEADTHHRLAPEWVKRVADVVNAQNGDELPVSVFANYEDGTMPCGSSAYEKRGIATYVPEWISANCIQCNQCSYVCPHAVIRPFLLTDEELKAVPGGLETIKGNGPFKEYSFRMQVSPLDCSGCGNCADTCPAKTKALVMQPLDTQLPEQKHYDYLHTNVGYKDTVQDKKQNLKNSQFAQPLFEFSGACAGCGETPYIKAITQLFGDRMMVSNATGCSSIYGGSYPSSPYTCNKNGQGPAWANSLFEDNAEYGFGMHLGSERVRDRLVKLMLDGQDCKDCTSEQKVLFAEWISNRADVAKTREIAVKLLPLIEKCSCEICKEIYILRDYFVPRSQWIFGGDGWAYDIGFGGLDHVLASGANVNMLVMDTEVYSNTGGQSSKATPTGAVAKFATSGKRIRKKDLGMMAMSYGYVYVAQVAMGAGQAQFFNALKEAEAYDGPSLIIAYSPCINHGLKDGMGFTQREEKLAVECGYWHNYRYNPLLEQEGKNPFILDSKEPDWSKFQDFLKNEVRFSSLMLTFPEEAKELFVLTEEYAKWRYNSYKRMAAAL